MRNKITVKDNFERFKKARKRHYQIRAIVAILEKKEFIKIAMEFLK